MKWTTRNIWNNDIGFRVLFECKEGSFYIHRDLVSDEDVKRILVALNSD